jgi:hypothetical protein
MVSIFSLIIHISADTQGPAQGSVPSQVATHPGFVLELIRIIAALLHILLFSARQ